MNRTLNPIENRSFVTTSPSSMLQLPDIERSTLVRLLIIAYIFAYFAVTLLKLVQSLCIIALIMLCVWDPVLVGFLSCCKYQDVKWADRPNNIEDYYSKLRQRYNFLRAFQSVLDSYFIVDGLESEERSRVINVGSAEVIDASKQYQEVGSEDTLEE